MSQAQDIDAGSLNLGQLLADCLQTAGVSDEEAMGWAGISVARMISETAEVEYSEVWRVMTHLPENYLTLLETPEGWVGLAAVVCGVLGVAFTPVQPLRH